MFRRVGLMVLTVSTVICSAFIPAVAGEYYGHSERQRQHWQAKPNITGGNGLPSYVSRVGTYAGGISAVRFKRNGIYFSADGGGSYVSAQRRIDQVEPRIIHVNERSFRANCAYESGVCVIRP